VLALGAHGQSVDGEKFSEDGSVDNGGFGYSYYQDSGRPNVVFYSQDDGDNVYCLEFREQFEVDAWDSAESYSRVSNSKVDYSDVAWSYENNNATNASYSYRIYSPGPDDSDDAADGKMGSIEFVFHRREIELTGDKAGLKAEAIKFDINIDGYTWETDDTTPENNTFVIEFRLEDCSDEFSAERVDSSESGESGEANDGGDDEADSTDDDSTKKMRKLDAFLAKFGRKKLFGRRRLASESDDGISSDDSHEFDLEAAFFSVARTATDENGGEIAVDLATTNSGDRLYIIFEYFGASMSLDPTTGVLNSGVASFGVIGAALMTAIAVALA